MKQSIGHHIAVGITIICAGYIIWRALIPFMLEILKWS
jgi:hypothetical protein